MHQRVMSETEIFDEKYQVVAVDDQSLVLRGVKSGKMITINSADSQIPITPEEYPVGKLVKLSDPSANPAD